MTDKNPEKYPEWKKLLAFCIEESVPPWALYPTLRSMQGMSEEQEESYAALKLHRMSEYLERIRRERKEREHEAKIISKADDQ